MSRAFVKESEDAFDDLPERPVPSATNWVTATGLAAIDAELSRLTDELAAVGEDRYERARISRDMRYWNARRASAQLAPTPTSSAHVQFGSAVTIECEDGRRDVYRIVGEDEADPAAGTISYVSPLARAIMGKSAGDIVRVNNAEIEIAAVSL